MNQLTKSFSAYDAEGLSTQINLWLQDCNKNQIKVKIESITNIAAEIANQHSTTDYSFSVLVLFSQGN